MVLNVHQLPQKFVHDASFATPHRNRKIVIITRATETVDTTHARHDNHVTTGQKRIRRRMSQPVNFFVDRRIFFDVGVARRDVCLRLIIIKIAYEIMNFIVREKTFELAEKLCGKRFVVCEH